MDAREHFALIRFVANSFVGQVNGGPFEDTEIFSDGLIGLSKALATFTKGKGKFSTHAVKCIRNEMIDGMRQRKVRLEIKRFSELDLTQNGEEGEAKFDPIDERNCEQKILAASLVEDILNSENSPRSKILRQYYLEGLTLEELSHKLSITREGARKRIKAALEYFKNKFEKKTDQYVLRGLEL